MIRVNELKLRLRRLAALAQFSPVAAATASVWEIWGDMGRYGEIVSPHPQGLQGSHLTLSQTSPQRHRTYFLLNNKACEQVWETAAGKAAVERYEGD